MHELNFNNLECEYMKLSSSMECLRRSRLARIRYHVLADALYWSDELPSKIDEAAEDAMRFVLRYRTSLILDCPGSEYASMWQTAKKAFPCWVGFRQDRCAPSERLKDTYNRLRKKAFDT